MAELPAELRAVFLAEAQEKLGTLGTGDVTARVAAAHALESACTMVGLGELATACALLAAQLRAGDPAAEAGCQSLARAIAQLAAPLAVGADWDPDELANLRSFFLAEAMEHFEVMQACLRRLAEDLNDRPALAEFMRKLHTLKGSAGSVMLDALAAQAHTFEDRVLALLGREEPLAAPELSELEVANERIAAELALLRRDPDRRRPEPPSADPATGAPDLRLGERRLGERRERAPAPAQTVRVEVQRIDELLDAASEVVFDRTRTARRVQELEGCVRDFDKLRGAVNAFVPELESGRSDAVIRAAELANELAEAVAQLRHVVAGAGEDAEALQRTSATLQLGVRRVRMTEVGRLFARFLHPTRDLARREHKQVQLTFAGEEVEIDKAVVERIAEPLLHLINNAVAHGIEPPAVRTALGKPAEGSVRVSALHHGDAVQISVQDDGQGVDFAAVRQALARARGVAVEALAGLGQAELADALFEPRLSTRSAADDVAGRGIGLDAVRDVIERLHGAITVETAPGRGTTFHVRLPLSTAVQQAMLFKVGGQVYAVPAARVEEAMQVVSDDVRPGGAGEADHIVLRHGETVFELPLVRLGALLGAPPPPGSRRTALVLAAAAGGAPARFALTCDKTIGTREIVVRELGPLLSPLPLYAGATISGAGKVQLILDVDHLAALALRGVRTVRPKRDEGPRRVLVVDDSRAVREALTLVLTQGGFAVDVAADGFDAWELLQDRPFDLLITDLEMPRLDGHELIQRVRQSYDLAQLPIIVVSSRTADTSRARVERAGANAFVHKPIRKKPILDAVHAALDVQVLAGSAEEAGRREQERGGDEAVDGER